MGKSLSDQPEPMEKATSMYLCHDVFLDQLIFRAFFGANLENVLSPINQSAKPTDLKVIFFFGF